MTKIPHIKVSKKDQLIDKAVVDMASNDDAWEKEIEVSPKSMPTSIRLNPSSKPRSLYRDSVENDTPAETSTSIRTQ